jgi:hypothetical protein
MGKIVSNSFECTPLPEKWLQDRQRWLMVTIILYAQVILFAVATISGRSKMVTFPLFLIWLVPSVLMTRWLIREWNQLDPRRILVDEENRKVVFENFRPITRFFTFGTKMNRWVVEFLELDSVILMPMHAGRELRISTFAGMVSVPNTFTRFEELVDTLVSACADHGGKTTSFVHNTQLGQLFALILFMLVVVTGAGIVIGGLIWLKWI